jgi:hypothetical protein
MIGPQLMHELGKGGGPIEALSWYLPGETNENAPESSKDCWLFQLRSEVNNSRTLLLNNSSGMQHLS